jgi:hypothetical protein
MAFRLRNFAPLGPEEGLNGWLHKMAGWPRQLLRQPGDRFIRALSDDGQPVGAVTQIDGGLAVCHICGYQMAAIISDDGWTIEACSYSIARKMFRNPRFDRWRQGLPDLPGADPRESARLSDQSPVSNHLLTSRP